MAERKKIKLISDEPRLALFLRTLEKKGIRIQMIPPRWRDYVIDWVADVGVIIRSRSYMAGTVASYASYGVMLLLFSTFPKLKRFGLAARVLGV